MNFIQNTKLLSTRTTTILQVDAREGLIILQRCYGRRTLFTTLHVHTVIFSAIMASTEQLQNSGENPF